MKTSEMQRVIAAGMVFVSGFHMHDQSAIVVSYLPVVRHLHARICEALLGWLWLKMQAEDADADTDITLSKAWGGEGGWMDGWMLCSVTLHLISSTLPLFISFCNSGR
jgi:hypothetical protein